MNDFLRSIKLVRDFTITLNCPKSYFMRVLSENTQPGNFGLFETFRSGPPFRGTVEVDQFKIRQRQTFTSNRAFMITVRGAVAQRDEKTVVAVEATAGRVMLGMLIIFFLFIIVGITVSSISLETFPLFVLPVLLIQIGLICLFPYLMLRRALNTAQREFEKEFHYLVRDYKS